ncbi:hypothetical protein I4U23_015006 [Adineta vaga]|nr:hypothetical protein I4U23_015006 [Adineta vaga]
MYSTKLKFCLNLLFLFIHYCSTKEDIYKEELYIRPLSSGHTYFNLLFTTVVSPDILKSNIVHHYHLFPKVIADIVRSNGVSEFHVSLTQGLWRYDRWGMPIVGAPPGAEVWAWFKPDEQKDVASRWTSFAHELGGLLCASLNFVASNVSSSSPHYSFRPQSTLSVSNSAKLDNSLLRYAALPREIVCTENLTPWKKLLPCVAGGSNHKGLAGLLDNAPKLHHSDYHSLRMDLRQICANTECTSTQLELSMALAIVVNTATSKPNHNEWTFRSIFGSNVAQSCPLSSLTNIYVDLQLSSTHSLNISPEPDHSIKQGTVPIVIYDLNNDKRKDTTFAMSCTHTKQQISNNNQNASLSPPIVVHRYATGYSVRDGGIETVIKIHEEQTNDQITLLYFEQIPWYFRVFLHTLKITTLDDPRTELQPDHISYVPGKDRERSYQLELIVKTKQSIVISFEFEMAFLKWNEFPPDPNHGFYIPSAVISTILPSKSNYILRSLNSFSLNQSLSSSDGFVRLYSESLLVNLPTPDFSMPFNVICLGCTAVALAFGGLHNLTTKEFAFGPKRSQTSFRQRLQDLKVRLMASRHALTQRLFKKTPVQHDHAE